VPNRPCRLSLTYVWNPFSYAAGREDAGEDARDEVGRTP